MGCPSIEEGTPHSNPWVVPYGVPGSPPTRDPGRMARRDGDRQTVATPASRLPGVRYPHILGDAPGRHDGHQGYESGVLL